MPGATCGQNGGEVELSLADRWIRSRLQKTVQTVTESIEGYRFDHAAQAIYAFVWDEYCDWYLELSKPALNSETATDAQKRGTRQTLVQVLEATLRLAHPIMPFITEEIWQRAAPLAGATGDTIMRQPFPRTSDFAADDTAEAEMQWVMDFIVGVRKIRSGMNIPPGKPLPVLLQNGSADDLARLRGNETFLARLAKTESISWLEPGDAAPESATSLIGEMKLLVPMAGLIDKDAELARLTKAIDELKKNLERADAKLANPNFVERAKPEVVAQERTRVEEMRGALANLEGQQEQIRRL